MGSTGWTELGNGEILSPPGDLELGEMAVGGMELGLGNAGPSTPSAVVIFFEGPPHPSMMSSSRHTCGTG
jgi:hypothetical protein